MVRKVVSVRPTEFGYVVSVEYRYGPKDFPEIARVLAEKEEVRRRIMNLVRGALRSDGFRYLVASALLVSGVPLSKVASGSISIARIDRDYIEVKPSLLGAPIVIELSPEWGKRVLSEALAKLRSLEKEIEGLIEELRAKLEKSGRFTRFFVARKLEEARSRLRVVKEFVSAIEKAIPLVESEVSSLRTKLEELWNELDKLDEKLSNALRKVEEEIERRAPSEIKVDNIELRKEEVKVSPSKIVVIYRGMSIEPIREDTIYELTPKDILSYVAKSVVTAKAI